jgi:hypothetical protein
MRLHPCFCWLTTALAGWLACAAAGAADPPFPPEHHPWGRFPAGAWKYVRTTTETLDDKGLVASVTITDTRTVLAAADEESYTLRSEVTLDVLGRRIATTPQLAKYGYYGETPGQAVSVKRLADATLTIDGRPVACELRQVTLESDGGKLTSTLHYAPQAPPFVLRRETSVENGAEEKRTNSLVEVLALNLPQRVRGELRTASYVKTTHKLPQGQKVTLEVHCDDVPGGVVAHSACETDAAGRVVRRSTLELIDYGLPSGAAESDFVPARRNYRPGKAARRDSR